METNSQLIKKIKEGGYNNVYPIAYIDGIIDKESNEKLSDILIRYNNIMVPWQGDAASTRNRVPSLMRRQGIVITYITDSSEIVTEVYKGTVEDIKNNWTDNINWELVPDLKFVQDTASKLPDGTITPEKLSPALQELISQSGSIVNMPDDEDLEQKDMVLKFKDRPYNPELASSMGYKILRKNWTNVGTKTINLLTQDVFNQSNTIYEIRYDFNLNNQIITIPKNCILKYEGGSLNNGHIVYQNTKIQGIESLNNITTEGLFTIIDAVTDEEDLHNNNGVLKFADREYNSEDFSGLGRIILRKNIVEIEDPTYGKVKKNVLYQDMINKSNTIYEIRYDFDLNGQEITIPEGCVLDFQGGSIYTTKTIKSSNSNITIKGKGSIIGKDVDSLIEFSEAKNISISGISFKSPDVTDCFAVRCFGVSDFRIENCSCENMYLIHSESLTRSYYTTTKENSNYRFSVVNNYVKNTHTRTDVAAIFLGYCYNFVVNNNIIETGSMGCTIWGGDAIHNILLPEDEHKAGNGIVSNNTFDCKQAGAWAGASKNVVFNSNIVKNTTGEALDAESCKDVMFTNNVLIDVNMGLNLFGYVDNVIFNNNIITLKGTNRISIYQTLIQTEEKQGSLEVKNNKFMPADTNESCLFALVSLASFKFIGNECTNMYYNDYSAGTIITKDNHFIYTIECPASYWIRTGTIKNIYEKNKSNLCCIIENNLFENKAENLTGRILWLDLPLNVEQDVNYSISNNTFINTKETVFVNSFSSLTSRLEIKFHNNKYNNLRYPIYIVNNESNNVLFFNWRNNTDLSNRDLFYNGAEAVSDYTYNINFAKGSIINLQDNLRKQEIFEVAIADTIGHRKSNWRRIDLSITFGYESDRPQNIEGGTLFFDRTLNKPIWWAGGKWVDATGADV